MKMKKIYIFLLLMIPSILHAEIQKVIIIPFSHQDIGFTATQDEIKDKYIETYNELPGIMEKFPGFKFTIETFWQYEQWLKSNPSEELQEFYLQMTEEGRIEFCGAFGTMHTGFMNGASLRETFRAPKEFAAEHGLSMDVVMMNDVPGFAQDLPDVMAEAGISYFIGGVNAGFRQNYPMEDSEGLYYWEGPKGGRILTWVPRMDYMQAVIYRSTSNIEEFVKEMEADGYPYDVIPVLAAHDNRGFRPGFQAYLNLVKDQVFLSGIEVVLGTPSDFFKHVEEKYSDSIPVKHGDWSGWWELTKVGGPYTAGMVRRSQQILENMIDWEIFDPGEKDSEEVMDNLLTYLEHANHGTAGWPGYLTSEQLYISNQTVVKYAETSFDGLTKRLDSVLRRKRGIFFWQDLLFNPMKEEGLRTIQFSRPDWNPEVVRVVKMNGQEYQAVPFKQESEDPWLQSRQGWEFAAVVPPGFSRFTVKGELPYIPEVEESRVIENRFYRIEFSSLGRILSIWDKEMNTLVGDENFGMVSQSPHTGWMYNNGMVPVFSGEAFFRVESNDLKTVCRIEYTNGPLEVMEITLPENQKAVLLNLDINRNEFEFAPYNQHSRDYYIQFPVPEDSYRFIYGGPDSLVEEYNGFTAVRPFLIGVKDLLGLQSERLGLTLASRHAFMAGYDDEKGYMIYQLAKHFSQCATNDQGIVDMRDIEPGTPEVIPFSFFFTSGEKTNKTSVDRYMNPVVSWSNN